MKLIIDIPEEDYNFVKKQVADGITNPLKMRIANGIPLEEEFEKIKAELNNLDFDFGNYYDETEAVLNKINSVLDKHIEELKGENNE